MDRLISPKKLGTITIPKFSINGASSQPIEIHVTQNSHTPKANDLVEMQATLDKTTLYPEESAYLKTRLVIKTDPRSIQSPQIIPPSAHGLTLTPVGEQQQYQSILNGVNVTVVDQDFRITADKPGHYIVKGPEFKGSILYTNTATRNTSIINADTKAKEFDFTVEPKPAHYKGDWLPTAKLTLSQQWLDQNGHDISTTKVHNTQVGDSITRIITMDVAGLSAEQLPNIVTHYPSSIRVYADKPQFKTLPNNVTRMTLKQVLIPQQPGDIKLESVNINWWNSQTKKQQASQVAGLELQVTPSANQTVAPTPSAVPSLSQTTEKIVTVRDSGYWPYIALVFGVLWLVTLFGLIHTKRKSKQEEVARNTTNSEPYKNLTDAIKAGNAIRAQFEANSWLEQLRHRDMELEQTIRTELENLHRNEFKNSNSTPNTATLLAAIDKTRKKCKGKVQKHERQN